MYRHPSLQLAENPRTARKAAIKRASRAARTRMNALDREAIKDLERIYRDAAAGLNDAIQGYADSGGSLRLEVLQDLRAQIDARLLALSQTRDALLATNMAEAGRLGVEPFAGAAEVAGQLTALADEAVRFARTFVAEDGLQLSDRLWRIDNGARQAVTRAVESAVIQGHSASQAAQEFLARGEAVPGDVASKINAARAGTVGRAAAGELLTGEGNPLDNAKRVFRTEINRAHGEAYQAAAFEVDDVIGTRFLLSPNHPETDICDMHASANIYGLGPGVYPRDKNPWPAHPNTLSYVEVVFADEVSDQDKADKQSRMDWLDEQPPSVQQGVLGSEKKRAALERGILRENEIATPWRVLKQRYTRRGIDIDELVPRAAQPAGLVPGTGTIDRGAPKAPVSAALNVTAHKTTSERVLKAIDSVHDDGALPTIPIRSSSSRASYYGVYRHTVTGAPVDIRITAGGDHKELTLAHEIGHFLDHHGLPGAGFSSARHELMGGWRQAVRESKAYRSLHQLREGPEFVDLPGGGTHRVNRGYLNYLMSDHEMWARSYAQWITIRSKEPELRRQLTMLVARDRGEALGYMRQWDDDDFEAIAVAIDDVMKEVGWR